MLASILELPDAIPRFISAWCVALKQVTNKKRHVAGVSQTHAGTRAGGRLTVSSARENSWRLSFAEGRRGVQDCNCFSH